MSRWRTPPQLGPRICGTSVAFTPHSATDENDHDVVYAHAGWVNQANTTLDTILRLHVDDGDPSFLSYCAECLKPYPCPTRQAFDTQAGTN